MSARTQKVRTAVRQEQIARAALALIARRGLNALNLGALAKEVGVVPSAIYRHYPGKDAVLESVLDLISKSLLANVDAACSAAADPVEQLHLLLMRHVQLVRHHVGIPRVVFSEQIFAGNPGRRRRIHEIIRGYLKRIAGIVRAGQREGRIRADLSPETAAVMFLGLVQPALVLWLMSNRTFDVVRQVDEAWGLFRRMLQGPDTTPGNRAGELKSLFGKKGQIPGNMPLRS